MSDNANKMKIYKDVLCLEVASRVGMRWWYQTPSLAYTPLHVGAVKGLTLGHIVGTQKPVVAVKLTLNGHDTVIALNLPRSDIQALLKRRLWRSDFPHPGFDPEQTHYSPWPAYAENKSAAISLSNLGIMR